MRNLFVLSLFILSFQIYCQKTTCKIEKYLDCQINVPIIDIGCNRKEDIDLIQKLHFTELIFIKTKSDGVILELFRGYIRLFKTEFGMSPYFVPSDNQQSKVQSNIITIMYNCKNTYCLNAKCYDEVNNSK